MSEPKQPWARPSPGRPPLGVSGPSQNAPQAPAPPPGLGQTEPAVAPPVPKDVSPQPRPTGDDQRISHRDRRGATSSTKQLLGLGAAVAAVAGLIWGATTFSESKPTADPSASDVTVKDQVAPVPTVVQTTDAPQPLVVSGESVEWEVMIRSVAAVVAECSDGQYGGSAVVVLDGTYILTNNHVIEGDNCEYFACFTDSFEEEPTCEFGAVFVVGDPDNDLAVLQLIDSDGLVANSRREPVELVGELPSLGSELTHIGYPGLAGLTLTLTVGRLSGVTDECGFDELGTEYLKTDATGGPGMSGGGVFDNKGRYVGTHTAGCASSEERGDYSLVKPARYALALLQRIG